MEQLWSSLVPLEGGASGESFESVSDGEPVVVRIYAGRSRARGPVAPEIDAAVLELVRNLLPVCRVLEVRAGDPEQDLPGLLVTTRLPGERLDRVLPRLGPQERAAVGESLGVLLGRLAHMGQPRAGFFLDRRLAPADLPPHAKDAAAWVAHHEGQLDLGDDLPHLLVLADLVQDVLDEAPAHHCLVHGDFNAANLLVDPETLTVTGLVDWEFAHAGSPYADLGNLVRHGDDPALVEGVLRGYAGFMPGPPDPLLLQRARAADLFALVELAARPATDPSAERAREELRRRIRAGSARPRP